MKTISIITVVYNGKDVLEPTIRSVFDQTYSGIEYVIIDGNSNDGTIDILERYRSSIDVLVSEPDQGIYDAMNKGLARASGDYVLFLNAGDSLFAPSVIEDIFSLPTSDIYYGETMLVDEKRNHLGTRSELTTRRLPDHLNWKSLKKGLVVSHQSIIVRRAIAPNYIMGNLSADIDWVIKSLKKSHTVTKFEGIISEFLVGGISDQKKLQSLRNRFAVMSDHYGLLTTIFLHLGMVFRWLRKKPVFN